MKLILENPYRILGLPITASDREIAKRGDDLAMYIEMGMTKKFEHDLWFDTNPIPRTKESLQRALSQLELGSKKIFHSAFWFYNNNSVDQLVFELLNEGQIGKASQLWSEQTFEAVTPKTATNYRNQAIFYILQLDTKDESYINDFLFHAERFFQGSWHSNVHSLLHKIGGDNNRLGQSDIQLFLMEELQKHVFSKSNGYSSKGKEKEFLEIFSGSDENIRTKAIKKFTEEPIHRLEVALEECKKKRMSDNSKAYSAADALLVSAQMQLSNIENILSTQNIHYQFLADKVAGELLVCSTNYYNWASENDNSQKPLDISEKITYWASKIVIGSEVKRKINEDLATIEKLRKQKTFEEVAAKFVLAIKKLPSLDNLSSSNLTNIPTDLKCFLDKCLPLLNSSKNKVDEEEYTEWCDIFTNVLLNYSIEYANQTSLTKYSDLLQLLQRVQNLSMSYEVKQRFNRNYNVLKSNNDQANTPSANSSGGCYIATLVYGDYDSPEVLVLRRFRDNVLAKSKAGRLFIKFYYSTSPSLVRALKNRHFIQDGIRRILDSLVKRLSK